MHIICLLLLSVRTQLKQLDDVFDRFDQLFAVLADRFSTSCESRGTDDDDDDDDDDELGEVFDRFGQLFAVLGGVQKVIRKRSTVERVRWCFSEL